MQSLRQSDNLKRKKVQVKIQMMKIWHLIIAGILASVSANIGCNKFESALVRAKRAQKAENWQLAVACYNELICEGEQGIYLNLGSSKN